LGLVTIDFLSPLMIKKTGLFIMLTDRPDKAVVAQGVPGYRNLPGM